MIYSKYQEAIFANTSFSFNLQIEAVAGSGKTFTLTEFAKGLDSTEANLALAFNRSIADDFAMKFPSTTQCSTLHALGFNFIRQNQKRIATNERKTENILKYKILGFDPKTKKFPCKEDQSFFWEWKNEVSKIVSIFKSRGCTSADEIPKKLPALCEMYQLDIPEVGIVEEVYHLSLQQEGVIDFDDMILYPVINRYEFPHFKNIFVDEAQDLNICQQQFIQKLCNTDGRLIVAGDSHQAIYGFRGASPEAMGEFKTMFSPIELPLSISYRCAKRIVNEARYIVPQIESAPDAEEGVVESITESILMNKVSSGDFILCRLNAPLVHIYLQLKSRNLPAKIRGAKIVKSLTDMILEVKNKFSSCNLSTIEQYRKYINGKSWKKWRKVYQLELLDIIEQFSKGVDSDKLIETIIRAFSDSTEGIILSSIHGVKGLETNRVFLISPELLPHPRATLEWELQQENNLKYVAITRAKKEFYYVISQD